jgi:hypothetical protein
MRKKAIGTCLLMVMLICSACSNVEVDSQTHCRHYHSIEQAPASMAACSTNECSTVPAACTL